LSLSYGAREDCAEEDISAEQVSNKTNSKLHSEQIQRPYFSPNITGAMISQKMRWTGHVVRIGEKRHTYIHTNMVSSLYYSFRCRFQVSKTITTTTNAVESN